ncbi:MAG: hydantoinase B/oxoprolinase family protein, partial [Planctomycetota bacterium]
YKGSVAAGSTPKEILDPERRGDPQGYFEGYSFRLGDDIVPVASFHKNEGRIVLARALRAPPTDGAAYDLISHDEAPVAGVRWLMGLGGREPLGDVEVRLGTTKGTNALLEHEGAPAALVTTRGFADALHIAHQNRPKIFDLHIRKPRPLCREVLEVAERIDARGKVLVPLDEETIRADLSALLERGIDSLAVCLMNSYANGSHEKTVEKIALEVGFDQVSLSTSLVPLPKLISRGDTTAVDAYLSPVIRGYIAGIQQRAPGAKIRLMTSAGALTDAENFVGKDSIFSGPAGGVVGFAKVAEQAGFKSAIGLDMGGTSTDVSRFDGEFERRWEMEVKDREEGVAVRVMAPMLSIETVAAGGGSVCRFDGQKPVVGPRSAGADPGPACYGRGGPLTLTDVNFMLGRILPDNFPFPLDREASERALDSILSEVYDATAVRYSREELAEGFVRIANSNMASPVKKISLARGIDPRDHVLVSFGGAGGQHAAAVARLLGIDKVLFPPLGGVLSALGIGLADVKRFGEHHVGKILTPESLRDLKAVFDDLSKELASDLVREGIDENRILPPRHMLDLRYSGQETPLTLIRPDHGDWLEAFEKTHHKRYGFTFPRRPVEIVAARVELTGKSSAPPLEEGPSRPGRPSPVRTSPIYWNRRWVEAEVHRRESLVPGDRIDGPAIVLEGIGTVIVDPATTATVTPRNDLLITAAPGEMPHEKVDAEVDPITLELFNNHFASIAEQMGALLQKTALSTNVKERLDFSCALFDKVGELVVNAPHIPVHLGAMGECVKTLLKDGGEMQPGDVFVTNDPYRGGSHLPDVTVITPVFTGAMTEIPNPESRIPRGIEPDTGYSSATSERKRVEGKPETRKPDFFSASRAHHAEIGGIAPGSMPPFSRTLGEEGVVIRGFRLVSGDRSSEDALLGLLSSGPHPSRTPLENIADINAQVAANHLGVSLLREMTARHGLEGVTAYMAHIRRAAAAKMREALRRFDPGKYGFTDHLDDGSPIAVSIEIRPGDGEGQDLEAVVDFTGTGPVLAGNLNANRAIVSSAVLYSFRTLMEEDIPLNGG